MRRNYTTLILVLSVACGITACGGGGSSSSPADTAPQAQSFEQFVVGQLNADENGEPADVDALLNRYDVENETLNLDNLFNP